MKIRPTEERDWKSLKEIRLAALLDIPTAFGVSYQTAIADSDEKWKQRSLPETMPKFWLAFGEDVTIGIIGAGLDQAERYNIIAMWVKPEFRGLGFGKCLVSTVKTHAVNQGYEQIFLDVSPDNLIATKFYIEQGFVFIDEEKPLDSHPDIQVQTMKWQSLSQNN